MSDTLVISTSSIGFDYNLELNSWLQGMNGYRVYPSGEREELEGNLGLDLKALSAYAQSSWIEQIPPQYRKQTRLFPEIEYYMLWLAANSSKAAQLLMCRPLLVALICKSTTIDKQRALEMAEKGQREILQELNLDSSKAALKFIDKLRLDYKSGLELTYVEKYLNAQTRHYLRFKHYPVVNDLVFNIDRTLPMFTGTCLGMALAKEKRLGNIWHHVGYVKDTVMLGQSLDIARPYELVGKLKSFNELKALHDRWAAQRVLSREIRPSDADSPYPILHGQCDPQLIHIANYDELLQESAEQQHCIVGYHPRIAAGEYVAFKMEAPERVTVGVRVLPWSNTRFEIDQIKCKHNAQPTVETRKLVRKLIRELKVLQPSH